ncbi:MAG: hypothetical protein ABIO01_01500 [Ferruginibacter sp.]
MAQSADSRQKDITGLWKGTLYNDTTQQFYRYEVAISEEKGKLSGFSHTWFILDDKQYFGVKKVRVKKINNKIIIEDVVLISNNYPIEPAKGVRQLNILELNATDSSLTLTGPFTTNQTKEFSVLTGAISLSRKNDYWQSALVPHLEELGLVNQLSFVKGDVVLNRNIQSVPQREKEPQAEKRFAVTKPSSVAKNEIAIQKSPEEETAKPSAKAETGLPESKTALAKNAQPPQKIITDQKAAAQTDVAKNNKTGKKVIAEKDQVLIAKDINKLPENKTGIAKNNKIAAENKVAPPSPRTDIVKNNEPTPKPVESNAITKTSTTDLPPLKVNEKALDLKLKDSINTSAINLPATFLKNNEPAADVKSRKTLQQQTVYFKSDSLQLSLYDNGEVDGDTVSVLMNGVVIMSKQGLSTNAVRKTIFVNGNEDSVELVMYAENLGSIPPNTGLLVVRDGKDIYEIRFSGDLQKNAAIIFRRKKIN